MFRNDGMECSEDGVERGIMKADGVWGDAWWPVCDSRGVDRGGKGDKVLGASKGQITMTVPPVSAGMS